MLGRLRLDRLGPAFFIEAIMKRAVFLLTLAAAQPAAALADTSTYHARWHEAVSVVKEGLAYDAEAIAAFDAGNQQGVCLALVGAADAFGKAVEEMTAIRDGVGADESLTPEERAEFDGLSEHIDITSENFTDTGLSFVSQCQQAAPAAEQYEEEYYEEDDADYYDEEADEEGYYYQEYEGDWE
ncbi:hypothetical protein HNE_1221 [Hyphomonas neptunium ATCC 15444]|uniref:Uncharacterized protein n=2 Tax=Hyphomonas TaxID=85 RepID=Q0C2V4_HYPNA|nr:hypothetical protein HNE_1221 [Hyphomonas neptunium ATCC 15444]